jgi:hypothetical protein
MSTPTSPNFLGVVFSSQSMHVYIVGMVYSRRFRFGVLGTMEHGYGVVLGGNLFYARTKYDITRTRRRYGFNESSNFFLFQ